MASILRVRKSDGTVVEISVIVGPAGPKGKDGASAYQSALLGGYTGTELELNQALAKITEFINGGGSSAGAHAASHSADGVDPITPDMIGAAPAYTYGTEEIEAGSTSTEAEGTLHFVIE